MVDSRRKGADGERELIRLLKQECGIEPSRNLTQYQVKSQADISNIPGLAIEVKRHKRPTDADKQRWWEQALEQAMEQQGTPVLAYRGDAQRWRFVLPGVATSIFMTDEFVSDDEMISERGMSYDYTTELTLEGFVLWYKLVASQVLETPPTAYH